MFGNLLDHKQTHTSLELMQIIDSYPYLLQLSIAEKVSRKLIQKDFLSPQGPSARIYRQESDTRQHKNTPPKILRKINLPKNPSHR